MPDASTPSEPLDDDALAALLERLPRHPMLAGEGGIAVPHPGEPSTHLIKPEPDRFSGLAANEAYCLALARAIGLTAANAEWKSAGEHPFLLVERYDRVTDGAATQRLHQEDFAQALGVPSNRKYAAEGGPTFQDCFALLRRAATRPAPEVLKLADAAIFNLLRKASGDIVLAPLYDLVATLAWPDLSPRFAMKFGGAATLEEIDGECFTRFAEDAGLTAPFVRRRGQTGKTDHDCR